MAIRRGMASLCRTLDDVVYRPGPLCALPVAIPRARDRRPWPTSPEQDRAYLDAAASGCAHHRCRIIESRMRGESRPAVGRRIVYFEQRRLARRLIRKPIPAMLGVIHHRVGFSGPVAIHQVARQQIMRLDAPRITESERCSPHRTLDRPPKIDDGEAPLQTRLSCTRRTTSRKPESSPGSTELSRSVWSNITTFSAPVCRRNAAATSG